MTKRINREDGLPYLTPEQMEQGLDDSDAKIYRLVQASALTHRNPFHNKFMKEIPWDSEEYAVVPNDPRWILPKTFDLGAHEWYQGLPEDQQIDLGMHRFAQVARVGSEFEHALVAGIMQNNMWVPSNSLNKLYTSQESEEELRHIQMFDEMIKRIGVKVHGAPEWFRYASMGVGPVARLAPVAFWSIVLAGEEPIDHTQKSLLKLAQKGDAEFHPMFQHVMEWHVAEEARHISYADNYTKETVAKLGPWEKKLLKKSLPYTLLIGANTMLRPSAASLKDMGIPQWVADDVWWGSEHGRQSLQDLFTDTKKRAIELDILDEAGWIQCGLMEPNPEARRSKPSIPARAVGNLLRFSKIL